MDDWWSQSHGAVHAQPGPEQSRSGKGKAGSFGPIWSANRLPHYLGSGLRAKPLNPFPLCDGMQAPAFT
ncbi:hypothetical protein J4Q44_G00254130 [Coregonus suidteri]|uniref:Uncharacterized protein n=1 Tax=Coregonus suidteri TaxID=861788 RepID=A0AAN8LAY8_9TELE